MPELEKITKLENSSSGEQQPWLSASEHKKLGAMATAKEIEIADATKITHLERLPVAETLRRDSARIAIEDYILATQFLAEVASGTATNHLDDREMKCLNNVEGYIDRYTQKNPDKKILPGDVLRSAFKSMISRRNTAISPQNPINRTELKDLRHNLKTDYVLGLGEKLKDYIDSGRVKNIGEAKTKLRLLFSEAYVRQRKVLEPAGLYSNNAFQQEKIRDVENLFNGMRHELAFEEMVYEGNAEEVDNLFEIEETGRSEELQGIDMRLLAKVMLGPDGKYHFPSTEDEFDRCAHLAKVNIDVKASEKAVDEALKQRQHFGHDKDLNQPLIMWSHVYNDDFRLDLVDGRPSLEYSPNEALLYLSTGANGQLSVMRQLDKVPGLTYRLPSGGSMHPENFEYRYQDIKNKILDYINTNPGVVNSVETEAGAIA